MKSHAGYFEITCLGVQSVSTPGIWAESEFLIGALLPQFSFLSLLNQGFFSQRVVIKSQKNWVEVTEFSYLCPPSIPIINILQQRDTFIKTDEPASIHHVTVYLMIHFWCTFCVFRWYIQTQCIMCEEMYPSCRVYPLPWNPLYYANSFISPYPWQPLIILLSSCSPFSGYHIFGTL